MVSPKEKSKSQSKSKSRTESPDFGSRALSVQHPAVMYVLSMWVKFTGKATVNHVDCSGLE